MVDSIGYGGRVIRDSVVEPHADSFAVSGLEHTADPFAIEVEFDADPLPTAPDFRRRLFLHRGTVLPSSQAWEGRDG